MGRALPGGPTEPIAAAVLAAQLRAHAAAAVPSSLASAGVAGLMVLSLGPAIPGWRLLAWLAALAALIVARLWIRSTHLHAAEADAASPRWLRHYRGIALLHGLVWGAAAVLPTSLDEPGVQTSLVILLGGLTAGAMTLSLYDLVAALLFALPVLLPLVLRLLADSSRVPGVTAITGVMLVMLLGVFTQAARRAERERRQLAAARQAEAERTAGAEQAQALLQIIFDHAGEGICIFDHELRLQAWNARFLAYSGLDPALARAGTPLDQVLLSVARRGGFGPGDAEAAAARRLAELSSGEALVRQHRRTDGTIIEARSSPVPGGGMVAVQVDVTQRHSSEQALAENQRMLTLLLQHTAQGFWFIDNELRTLDANPAMCRMLGLSREQLLGRDIYEFVDAENEAIFRHHVKLRTAGVAGSYEIALTRADGTKVHCYNNATPIYDAAGRKIGAVGLFSDITPQKRAQEEVRRTGELLAQKSQVLEATLESLSQGVLSIDTQGRANAWNHRFLELLEIPADLMQTRPTLLDLSEYQTRKGHFGTDMRWIDEQGRSGLMRFMGGDPKSIAHNYQRTRADGTVIEVQSHFGADGSLVRTYTDITAREKAQRSLRESESRFRTMADGAPALIWLSTVDGSPVWFNQRWLSYTGNPLADELKRSWRQRIHPEDYPRALAAFEQAVREGHGYDIEFRINCADGRLAWIADNGIPRLGDHGGFDGFICYGWDITERRAAAEALIAAKDEAERANRAKSEFLSRMSHELRTPMNAILGFGQLLESDPREPLSPQQHERVQQLLRGGRHLLALINEVLDLARIEAGTLQLQLQPVHLRSLVDDCLRLVQPVAQERRVVLAAAPADDPGAVQADATRLRQVLLNLLSNAIKYNREGGHVEVRWQRQGDCLRIEVRDDGPGIDALQQRRLFQAFERLDADRSAIEGAGIGLALSKWLVDLMHGEIGVDSEPGRGSTFWLSLACGESPPLLPAPSSTAPALPPPTRQHTVLYIEDNPVNQVLMEGMLARRPQLRLLLAGLPEVGLTMATQARPDLVLLDIQLPGIDGFEVLRRLRAQASTRHIPVIAVSANAMQADIDEALKAGFDAYLTKPLELQRLLALVDSTLAGERPSA